MNDSRLRTVLGSVLNHFHTAFSQKTHEEQDSETDPLMDVFAITPELKNANRQYWGRELGMCWQRLVTALCRETRQDFGPALRFGTDEPCDLTVGSYAIDTKYRIGSGDSGTLKKFRAYANQLSNAGFTPTLLIVREDNLPAAIAACRRGGWTIYTGNQTFAFLHELTGFDIKAYLLEIAPAYRTRR